MKNACIIEISYIDPESYVSLANHDLRKEILKTLYRRALNSPISKQELAESIGVNYHQLVYQLNNHLKEFWTVGSEKKVRGTRMELIEPLHRNAIFITLGKENTIYIVDPLAGLFGSLARVGTRCDFCTEEEAKKCLEFIKNCSCASTINKIETEILIRNKRKQPFRPIDHAIVCALRGISKGEKCVITIPCENCAYINRFVKIEGLTGC